MYNPGRYRLQAARDHYLVCKEYKALAAVGEVPVTQTRAEHSVALKKAKRKRGKKAAPRMEGARK